MATLEKLIIDAVEDMLIQHCLKAGFDPESSALILSKACEDRKTLLLFARWERLEEQGLAEILGEKILYIEHGCFPRSIDDDAGLVSATERAIFMLYMASRDVLGSKFQQPFSLN
jgi:hypothetical protein